MSDKVLAITINYGQTNYTLDCIKSLLESNYSNLEVLLIDNVKIMEESDDLEKRLPKDERFIFRRLFPNKGYVGGINYGLETGINLKTDYFLILNNDTIIDPKAISELVQICKKYNNRAIVTGKVLHYDDPGRIQDVGYFFKDLKYLDCYRIGYNELDNGQFDIEGERDMLDDVFWLFSSHLYNDIGGYSNYFWFNNEQADFALRAKKAGYKLAYTHLAKLWHKGSPSLGGRELNPALAFYSMQGSLIYRYLHLTKLYFTRYYIRIVTGVILSFLKYIVFSKKDPNRYNYNLAKIRSICYFNNWLMLKNENVGANPFK